MEKPQKLQKWQVVFFSLTSGVFFILGSYFPRYDRTVFLMSLSFALLSFLFTVFWRFHRGWWDRILAAIFAFPGGFLFMSWRIASYFLNEYVFTATILLLVYLICWMFPLINPTVSKLLFREEFAPRTNVGKSIMNFVIGGGFSLAYFLMLMGSYGDLGKDLQFVFVGALSLLASAIAAQSTSEQFIRQYKNKINLKSL